jgi:hypothetical protein
MANIKEYDDKDLRFCYVISKPIALAPRMRICGPEDACMYEGCAPTRAQLDNKLSRFSIF